MATRPSLREAPHLSGFKAGDVLVLFGELFSRGYANGLVDEAERLGMTVIRTTVGRREKDGILRALTAEEMADIPKPFINIPLEAGFDLEPDSKGVSPVDQLKDIKLSDWENAKLDQQSLDESHKKAVSRFRANTAEYLKQLEPLIPAGANVLFAHLMAGGVPRTKIVMPLINRTVKGTGDRYLPSEKLWNSEIGRFCAQNFLEVTAETLRHLLELSAGLRQSLETRGSRVSYLAYGYHGTEILIDGKYQWQTYTPYIQGWAKKQLEEISKSFHAQNVRTCVYNCPEILTNSSSIFQGVEVSLYPLLQAFQKEAPNAPITKRLLEDCAAHLVNGKDSFEEIRRQTDAYFSNPVIQEKCVFDQWPQHTSAIQLETMLNTSESLQALHKDPKQLITAVLSEAVFEACGRLMLHDSWSASHPVNWLGHDGVARTLGAP
ncbi:MAG: hypothetical protein KF789_13800 [Bdellovibrionaceae bacterium]|nr:hypothetical protein [Pseudobdellovibrionaceae bacterium]